MKPKPPARPKRPPKPRPFKANGHRVAYVYTPELGDCAVFLWSAAIRGADVAGLSAWLIKAAAWLDAQKPRGAKRERR
jgi:hypothetical protein